MATDPNPLPDTQSPGQLELPLDLPPTPRDLPPTLRDRLDERRAANRAAYQALLAQGVMPDPHAVLALRVEALIDQLLDADQRIRFELSFETRMTTLLDRCGTERRHSSLLAPLTAPPGTPPDASGAGRLILPG